MLPPDTERLYWLRLRRLMDEHTALALRVGHNETLLMEWISWIRSHPSPASPQPKPPRPPKVKRGPFDPHVLTQRLGRQTFQWLLEKMLTWGAGIMTPTAIIYAKQAWGWASPLWQALRLHLPF